MAQQGNAAEPVKLGWIALRLRADIAELQPGQGGQRLRAVRAGVPGVERGLPGLHALPLLCAPGRRYALQLPRVAPAALLAHGVGGHHDDLAAVRVIQQHRAYKLLKPALVHPGAQDVKEVPHLQHGIGLAAAQPAVQHAEAKAQPLRIVAEITLAHLEFQVGHSGLELAAVNALAHYLLEHGAELFPGGDYVLLLHVAHLELDERLGAAVPDHHADRFSQAGGEHLAREHGLVVPAEHCAEHLHGRHALAVGYLSHHAAPGEAVAVVLVLFGGELVFYSLRLRLHGPLQRRDGQPLTGLKAAEVLLVEYGEHSVDIHVAVQVDVGVGG